MAAAAPLQHAGPEGTGRPMPMVTTVGSAEPVRPPERPSGRDTNDNRDERRDRARAAHGEYVAPRREVQLVRADDAPIEPMGGGVVSRDVVIEGRPMEFVDVTADSGRVSTRRTQFETRVLSNDPDQAADASLARFPPLKHNRFRPDTAALVDPGTAAPPVGSPADIGRRMFLSGPAGPSSLGTEHVA